MLSPNRSAARLLPLGLGLLLAAGCEKVPLLAPTGSTITLSAATTALSTNGTAQIVAQVIEAAGTPPHSGTHIIFTTTLGSIQPPDAETDINGRAVVTYRAGTNNGNAVITASSGGANTGANGALRIAVGTAAVGRVIVNASPSTVSALGGTTTITANVLDVNGNPLTSTAVSFSTTAGNLSASVALTDQTGVTSVTLQTSQQATVTASVGAQAQTPTTPTAPTTPTTPGSPTTPTTPAASSGTASGQVTVNVSAAPSLVITPPATLNRGLPASFTFAVTAAATNGSAVRDVVVDWGDGQTQNLGAITGNAVVSHTYNRDDTFLVSAVITDASGNRTTVSTVVSVIQAPTPTVIVTPTPQSAPGGSTISFAIDIRAPAGLSIRSVVVDWNDGQTQSLGGASGVITLTHTFSAGVRPYTITVTVVDSTGVTTTGSTTISITS